MESLRNIKGKTQVNETNLQQRMQQAEEKVLSLQDVIIKLQTTKKFLHLNAVEVKASIHSNISRLLESMRSREVWLLNQVDMILETKEVGLRCQEDQLNRAIGQLSNCLNLMDGGATLNCELNDLLFKIDSIGKHPVESPHISFRADIGSLRQTILEFGRVDSRRLPLEAFASPHLRSSSLPQPFEEYEDTEHHVFHKSVNEIQEKINGKSINFNIPKLSSDIPSWVSPIHTPAEFTGSAGSASDGRMDWTSNAANAVAAGRKKPTTACSVSQWLQEIKMEDEDDELMTPQLSSRFGNKGIVASASASCLLSGSSGSLHTRSDLVGDANREGSNLRSNCFSFLSPRLQDWLIDGEARLPKSKLPEAKERSVPFEPCIFRPTMMGSTPKENVLESCIRKIAALPADCWLAPSAESSKLESETGSSFLDNYSKKIAFLPWLISARGVTKELEQKFGNEHITGIMEAYTKRIANLKWLSCEEQELMSDDRKESEPCPDLVSREAEGILDACIRKFDSKSWLMKKGNDGGLLPENNKTIMSEYATKLSQMPPNIWLLSNQENKPKSSGDAVDGHGGESCSWASEKHDFTIIDDVKEGANPDDFNEFYNNLNSFPLDHWLLLTSTSDGNVSELEKFQLIN